MLNTLNKNTRDRIDFELSRTYFKSFSREADFQNTESNTLSDKNNYLKRVLFLGLICVITAAIVFSTVIFFKSKRVSFEVKINVENLAKKITEPIVIPEERLKTDYAEKPKKEERKITFTNGRYLYGFEKTLEGWEIPEWALQDNSYSASSVVRSTNLASKGTSSVAFIVNFPGTEWKGALIENEEYFNLRDFDMILADIYLPANAPDRLRGRFIFTTGNSWTFMEMARGKRLKPGRWTTITANIAPGSTDWKSAHINEMFKQDIHKIALKIESVNVPYSGPVYIDNIRVATVQKSGTC